MGAYCLTLEVRLSSCEKSADDNSSFFLQDGGAGGGIDGGAGGRISSCATTNVTSFVRYDWINTAELFQNRHINGHVQDKENC